MRTENIFQVGKEAVGDSFIGRQKEVQEIAERALSKGVYHALSIVGLTRVGKSSIVINAVNCHKANEKGIIYVKVVLSEYLDFISFWKAVIWEVQKQVCRVLKIKDDIMDEEFERVAVCPVSDDSYMIINTAFKEILLQLNEHKIPILLIVDEFDWAREMFHKKQRYFEMFRTIASSAEYLINIILISRRSLYVIEESTPENSTFHGVFQRMTVNGFSDQDMERYYSLLSEYGIELTEAEKEKLIYYCGNIPYLLSLFGHDMVEAVQAGTSISAEDIYTKNSVAINHYYEDIRNQLIHDHLLEALLQALGDTSSSGGAGETSALMDMGLICCREGRYVSVCHGFTEYAAQSGHPGLHMPTYSFKKETDISQAKTTPSIVITGDKNKVQMIGTDNSTKTVNHQSAVDMETLIPALERLLTLANETQQKALEQAISAVREKNPGKLQAALKTVSSFVRDTASNVAAGVIVEYMKMYGVI